MDYIIDYLKQKKNNHNNILNTDKYKDIVLEKKETEVERIFKKFTKNVFIIWKNNQNKYNYSTKTLSGGLFRMKYIINHNKIINLNLCNIIEDNINKGYSLLVPDSNNNKYELLEKSSFYKNNKNNENLKKIVTDKEKLDLTVKSINKDINKNLNKDKYNELICFNNQNIVENLLKVGKDTFLDIFKVSIKNNSIRFIIWKDEDNKNIYKLSMNNMNNMDNINDKEIFHFNIGFENNQYYLIKMNCESDNYNTFYKKHLLGEFKYLYAIIKRIMKINNNNDDNYKYIKCGGEGEKRGYRILNLDNIKDMFNDNFNNNAQ